MLPSLNPFGWRKRRADAWLTYSWLYLMRRVRLPFCNWLLFRVLFSILHWLLPILWGGRYKIGISNDPKRRRKGIDRDLPGGIIVVLAVPVFKVSEKESQLHKEYRKDKYKPKRAGRGAGKTEHFYLNFIQVIEIKATMIFFFLKSNIIALIALTFMSYVIYRYYALQQGGIG